MKTFLVLDDRGLRLEFEPLEFKHHAGSTVRVWRGPASDRRGIFGTVVDLDATGVWVRLKQDDPAAEEWPKMCGDVGWFLESEVEYYAFTETIT